jgi:hypothetical protein
VSIWFKSSQRKLGDSDVFPQIGEYGSRPALVLNTGQDGWHAIVKLPPGLSPGWHEVKIRVRDSAYSNIVRIGVGVPTVEAIRAPSRQRKEVDSRSRALRMEKPGSPTRSECDRTRASPCGF